MARKRYDTSDSSTDSDGASDAARAHSRPQTSSTNSYTAWVLLLVLILVVAGTLGASSAFGHWPSEAASSSAPESVKDRGADNVAAEAATRANGFAAPATDEKMSSTPTNLSTQPATASSSPRVSNSSTGGSPGGRLKLIRSHEGKSFLEGWEFFHLPDPTEVCGSAFALICTRQADLHSFII